MSEPVTSVAEDQPAVHRAREIAQLIDSGDRAAARQYAGQHYAPSFLTMPIEMHLGFVSQLHDQTRGIEVVRVHTATPTETVLVIRGVLTGIAMGLTVQVEAEPPHLITGIGLQPVRQPPSSRMSAGAFQEELGLWLERLAAADVFSGAVGVAKDGELLFAHAYGEACKDYGVPNTLDTAFNLGSMNKMFTAVAIAQLVEGGRLSFDDLLATYLPGFPSTAAAQEIRIKHLLSHTSGLGSYFTPEFMVASRLRFRTIDDYMQLARDQAPSFPPGTSWAYSNTGFLVLGAIIEAVTDQDYFSYVRTQICEPLGMRRTEAYELDRVNWNLAVGYEKEFSDGGITFRNNLFEHVVRGGPAGGGYSTVEDLVRFATALLSHRLLSPATTELLLSAKPELSSPAYGYGFGIDQERRIAGHSGGFVGISSNLDLFLDSGYVAIVLSNYGMASMPVVARLRELIQAVSEHKEN